MHLKTVWNFSNSSSVISTSWMYKDWKHLLKLSIVFLHLHRITDFIDSKSMYSIGRIKSFSEVTKVQKKLKLTCTKDKVFSSVKK